MTNFIVSQILGLIALVLVCISYSFNDKGKFLIYQISANAFYSASFLSLGVFVGGLNTIVSIIRVITLYFFERKDKSPPISVYVLFAMSYLLVGNICFQTQFDIMAIIAYEFFNVAMFIRDIGFTRILMIFPNILIVIYNIISQTYTNAILDLTEIIVLLIMIVKFSWSYRYKRYKHII